jgi:hypothetical protein
VRKTLSAISSLLGGIVLILALFVAPAVSFAAPTDSQAVLLAPSDVAPTITPPKVSGKPVLSKGIMDPRKTVPAPSEKVTTGFKALVGPCPSDCHLYASAGQYAVTSGLQVNTRVQSPQLDTTNDTFTLGETAVLLGSGSTRQVVEYGWAKNPSIFGDSLPHLFAGAWKNNTFQGWNGAFTDYAGNSNNLGMSLTAGQDITLRIQYDGTTTPASPKWWLWLDPDASGSIVGNYVGYFDYNSIWGASPAVSPVFSTGDSLQAWGEVASTKAKPCSDMGSGDQGSGGALPAAFFGSMAFISGPAVALTTWAANTPGYSLGFVGTAGAYRTFYYGGPGWNSAGTAVGTKGSC